MEFSHREDGLYCLHSGQWRRIGDHIKVVARTRERNLIDGHGFLVEWRTLDGITRRKVFPACEIRGENHRQARDYLFRSGYDLATSRQAWSSVQEYLIQAVSNAPAATVVQRSGWHDNVYATPSWVVGGTDEPHYYVGAQPDDTTRNIQGDLESWHHTVGRLCRGNSYAIFSVGAALAAPLLHLAEIENGGFHFVGASSTGKSILLQIAASVCGSPHMVRSWVSTANGLAAAAAEHNDLVLPLDEVGLARPEDIDTAIYHIMNGASKLRSTITGRLDTPIHWRTMALSTGELWLSELLSQGGKVLRAGQATRLVEIPVVGRYGCFNDLHDLDSARALADTLKAGTQATYGSLLKAWMEHLTRDINSSKSALHQEVEKINNAWTVPEMASQVQRVIRRFSVVACALRMASRQGLLPWTVDESTHAVHEIIMTWLSNRGHMQNAEEQELLQRLQQVIPHWRCATLPVNNYRNQRDVVLLRQTQEGAQWLIPKSRFLRDLKLPARYTRDIEPLVQRGVLETNEISRGTLKLQVGDRWQRWFALWPEKVEQLITEAGETGISQFPKIPTSILEGEQ